MNRFPKEMASLFHEKGEQVINLPEWILSASKCEEFTTLSNPALIEIAGRDSVAAAIRAIELYGFTDLIPTYAFTGTESGSWALIERAAERLAAALPEIKVHELMVVGSLEFWRALNGRFIDELISRYGFYTPCIGCHMYLHSVRIPLAVTLGKIPLVSGERELHNGTIKVNQTSQALEAYAEVARSFGIDLLFPLQHIRDGKEIDKILRFDWKEGKDQPGCVLSGNFRKIDGSVGIKGGQVRKYLEGFLSPATKKIIESYASGVIPDHIKLAAEILYRS